MRLHLARVAFFEKFNLPQGELAKSKESKFPFTVDGYDVKEKKLPTCKKNSQGPDWRWARNKITNRFNDLN